ncbi:MAG TPA: VWA domain-containing protein, partial [Rhodobacteraceae bacterium]|nr:VWA domain-containing protein [Paracoccaceae bacterium]
AAAPKQSFDYAAAPTVVAPMPEIIAEERPDSEAFSNEDSASVKIAADEPVSTFSIDVDTASYAVVRSSLMAGQLPPRDAVRVEEMVNYFPYDYPAPDADNAPPFKPTVTVMQTPWNADTRLVHIALQGKMPALDDRPPLNLVFLIDTSGSMQDANKLPLLKQSFRLMLGQLRPEDKVAIVTYAGSAGQVLEPTPASERSTILAALERLEAGGSTDGQEGLRQAYSVAEGMADDGDVTRVILATDGDFNVGLSDPDALKDFIAEKRDSGTYLSVLGFGRGNLDDATMQALAQNGNGTAAYIDTLTEAQKVLVDQLSGALFPIADDVKIQVEFNPAAVAEYRLIGYETRALRREDFNNDKIDAGEIGAGHAVTAIYEITPVGSPAILNDPLRYQNGKAAEGSADEIGFLRLRYKQPGESKSRLIEQAIPNAVTAPGSEQQFGAAIAGFGQLLRGSDYLGDWGWDDAIDLANGALGEDRFGYRREAVSLMRLAQSLSRK